LTRQPIYKSKAGGVGKFTMTKVQKTIATERLRELPSLKTPWSNTKTRNLSVLRALLVYIVLGETIITNEMLSKATGYKEPAIENARCQLAWDGYLDGLGIDAFVWNERSFATWFEREIANE
jgi:hypothetical protein